jgi:hypothetical protein
LWSEKDMMHRKQEEEKIEMHREKRKYIRKRERYTEML